MFWSNIGRSGSRWASSACLVGAILFRLRHLAVEAILADRQLNARLNGFWEERLVATADLRGNGAVEHVLQCQQPLNWQVLQLTRKGRNLGWTVHGVYIGLHIIGSALIFAVAAALYLRGGATLGSVYLVFHYLGLVVINLRGFVRELDSLQRATASLRRVEELFARQNRLSSPAKTAAVPPPVDDVLLSFTDVTFAYENRPVLNNLSFSLGPGEKLALLGRTGSGKSTLARLIFRFYDPQSGQITLHGQPLSQWPLPELRSRIGLVYPKRRAVSAPLSAITSLSSMTASVMSRFGRRLAAWGWELGWPRYRPVWTPASAVAAMACQRVKPSSWLWLGCFCRIPS